MGIKEPKYPYILENVVKNMENNVVVVSFTYTF